MKWNDSSPVTVTSNHHSDIRVKNEQKKTVDQLFLIKMYNKGIRSVDVCDRLLSSYRPGLRSRKWYWNVFLHMLNRSVVAAYEFYNHINLNGVSHIQFRKIIARVLVKVHCPRKHPGRPTTPPGKAVRFDGINHNLESIIQKRYALCQNNARLCCAKCRKRLHKL